MSRRLPFGFLFAVREAFVARYLPEHVRAASDYAMQAEFERDLKEQMGHFNSPEADRLTQTNEKLRQVQDIVTDNIDKILQRQDRIEILVDRCEAMSVSAASFQRGAMQVRRRQR